jgi:hypothetical protein
VEEEEGEVVRGEGREVTGKVGKGKKRKVKDEKMGEV